MTRACGLNGLQAPLGDILLQQEAVERAHKVFRSVVDRAVDADGVFQRLLNCCDDFEAKQAELRHIHGQLMAQTQFACSKK